MEELDAQGTQALHDAAQAMYEVRVITVQHVVSKRLLELEAAANKESVGDLVQREIKDKAVNASLHDAQVFIAKNAERVKMEAPDIEQQVQNSLNRRAQQNRRKDFVAELLKKHRVRINLPSPRYPDRLIESIKGNASNTLGPSDAPVTLVEFSDFGCGYCKKAAPMLRELQQAYPSQLQIVFRHLPFRDQAASYAAECAAEQGKFWQAHDALFETTPPPDNATLANKIDLDKALFEACLGQGPHPAVLKDSADGRNLNIPATPAFFINGKKIMGAKPVHVFKNAIDLALKNSVPKKASVRAAQPKS